MRMIAINFTMCHYIHVCIVYTRENIPTICLACRCLRSYDLNRGNFFIVKAMKENIGIVKSRKKGKVTSLIVHTLQCHV